MPPTITFLPQVVLKFRDSVKLPYIDDVGPEIEERGIGPWSDIEAQFPGVRIRRLYRELSVADLERLADRAVSHSPTYKAPNLLTYFVVAVESPTEAEQLANVLKAWTTVEEAYRDSVPKAPCSEGYLGQGGGIAASTVRGVGGANGAGIAFIDVETGWTLDHDALKVHAIPPPLSGVADPADAMHGTQTLGVVCGNDNVQHFFGVAPNPGSVNVVSYKPDAVSPPSWSALAQAILVAFHVLATGDVLLIEANSADGFPVEIDSTCYTNISMATAAGVVVVEPAGNGGSRLDIFVDSNGNALFTRAFRDSLAIMVASASSGTRTPRPNSNFGTRIDCFAWGDDVFTSVSTGPGDTSAYAPPCFLDTSAAAAIIAGAALSTQGMFQHSTGQRLDASQLRAVLSDPNNGTAVTGIGVMPDLHKIANRFVAAPTVPTNVRIIS